MGQSYCKHVTVAHSETGHSGAGWYVEDAEYPEEGAERFDHKPTMNEIEGIFCECGPEDVKRDDNLDALLDALRAVDLQTLPEHIAKLVAAWKAGR